MKVTKEIFKSYKSKALDLNEVSIEKEDTYMLFQYRGKGSPSDMIIYSGEDLERLVSLVGTASYKDGWYITRLL